MDREKTIQELLQTADTLKGLYLKIRRMEREREDLRDDYMDREYHHYADVYSATDDKGKPLFTNEERREREVEHRMRSDVQATALRERLRQYDEQIDELQAEYERLESRQAILLVGLGAPLTADILDDKL